MIYRKTWFDYVLWAVYAGLCIILLASVGNRLYAHYVGESLAKLGSFLFFAVLFCLYPGIHLSSRAIRKKRQLSAHFFTMAEALVVSVSFVFGTILRIKEGFAMTHMYGLDSVFEPGDYYELAMIKTGGFSMSLAHGMGDLYVRCLRVVFSFLGNSVAAAMLFQVFLQIIAMIFAYLAVRKAAGRFVSCIVLFLLSFSRSFIYKIDVIDPECLLIALFLAGLYLVLSFVKASLKGRDIFGELPGAFLLGAVLGLLCYLEGGCVILFLFLAGLLTGKTSIGERKKRRVAKLFIVIAGGCAGFFGAIAEDAATSGVIFYQGLMWWVDTYLDFSIDAKALSGIWPDYLFFVILLLMASFVVFEFIRGGREQDFSLWFLPCILVTPAFLIDFSVSGFSGLALFFWIVMAGLGLKNTVFGGEAEFVMEKIEEINAAAVPVVPAPIPAEEIPAAPASEEAVSEKTPKKKPRFIENPLPLPKKHVKREMDYDHEVLETDMHYDIDVAEGDDFDR